MVAVKGNYGHVVYQETCDAHGNPAVPRHEWVLLDDISPEAVLQFCLGFMPNCDRDTFMIAHNAPVPMAILYGPTPDEDLPAVRPVVHANPLHLGINPLPPVAPIPVLAGVDNLPPINFDGLGLEAVDSGVGDDINVDDLIRGLTGDDIDRLLAQPGTPMQRRRMMASPDISPNYRGIKQRRN